MANDGARDFWRAIIAAFLPPVAVFMQVGLGSAFWINLILTFLMFVPGQLHALWVIVSVDDKGRPSPGATNAFIALCAGFFLPPLGVFLRRGVSMALLVNVLLTLLFWFPGSFHALWVITTTRQSR